jgi:hypothetical protein
MTPQERNRAQFPHCWEFVRDMRDAFGGAKDLYMRDGDNVHGKAHDFSGRDAVSMCDIRLKPSAMEICERNKRSDRNA